MADDEDRASPPLPSRGAYNIDFDTLDDSFNPFETKKGIRNSPPLRRKEASNKLEKVNLESSPACGDGDVQPKESAETPKKKKSKSKSSKRASGVTEGDSVAGATDSLGAGEGQENPAGEVAALADIISDQPEKPRKVVKKKSRPVSKNLEGQAISEKQPLSESPVTSTDQALLEDAEAKPSESTTSASTNVSMPQNSTIPEDSIGSKSGPSKHDRENILQSNENLLQKENTQCHSQQDVQQETTPEETLPQREVSGAVCEKTHAKPEQSPAGDGVDSPPKKEKSASKVKKTKSKVKKSSSSPRPAITDGEVDGCDRYAEQQVPVTGHDADRGSADSQKFPSQKETFAPNDSLEESDVHKSKHPAARVLEKQVKDKCHSQPLARGESAMADSHSTESVVKLVQVLKYSQSDWNKLRQELELGFQAQLLAKEKEWSSKLADRDARLATVDDTNKKLRQTNEDMRSVMGEFEKTIGQLQSEKEKTSNASQQSLQDVVKERDQALEDLQSVETAFSDLHRRYEKTKGVVDGFKQNEEVLKKCVQDLQTKLKKTEQKVQILKDQAEEKLERATEEIEKTKKSTASEIARLEAAVRRAEVQVQSMESSLEQKVKENKELAAICDELIAKVQ